MSEREELFDHVVTPWTVGDLRRALEGIRDDLPLQVNVADKPGGDIVSTQVVIGAGFGAVESQVERILTIECEFPPGEYYRRVR